MKKGLIIFACLVALIPFGDFAATGGLWIPGALAGQPGDGFWLYAAPSQASPLASAFHHGSEVVADRGSTGRLKDDGHRTSICDNEANGSDAAQRAHNHQSDLSNTVFDTNGVHDGCGVITMQNWKADEHRAFEQWSDPGNYQGASGWSIHWQ